MKEGATRSGKTYLDYFLIKKRLLEVRGLDGLVVFLGNTKGTLQRNVIDNMRSIWGEDKVSNIKADNTATVFGERVYCLGADKVTQVNRLRGSSIKYCYCDEVATYSEEVFSMLKSRLDKPYSKCDMTCNPESPTHWLYDFLTTAKEKQIDLYRQSYCIDDNVKLDPKVVSDLKKEYAGTVYYDRYILGKWVKAEGLVYPKFNSEHIIDTSAKEYYRFVVSVDYGIENATVFLLLGVDMSDNINVLKEYYYSGRDTKKEKTDAEYTQDMEEFTKDYGIECVVVDPSASSFIVSLKQAGFIVKKADNSVLDGIRTVNSHFGLNTLFVDRKAINTIRELQSYSWDTDSAKKGAEKPIKTDDHACDALRYGVMELDRQDVYFQL